MMVSMPIKRLITVDEYYRMAETGIISPEERVELLDGEIYTMAPIGDGHVGSVNKFNTFFVRAVGDRAIVSPQNPIRLSDLSEPQPDIVILRWRDDWYGTGKAGPADILLLIEIADSTLRIDRTFKLPRYALAGIREVWIVDLNGGTIEVCREPYGNDYRRRTLHGRGEQIAPAALPDVLINVTDVVG